MPDDDLKRAVEAYKRSDKEQCLEIVGSYLKTHPQNELAWLLAAKCIGDKDKQRQCYRRVLQINPDNKYAKAALKPEVKKKPGILKSFMQKGRKVAIAISALLVIALIGCCLIGSFDEGGEDVTPENTPKTIESQGMSESGTKLTPQPTDTPTVTPTSTDVPTPTPLPLVEMSPMDVQDININGTDYQWKQLREEMVGKRLIWEGQLFEVKEDTSLFVVFPRTGSPLGTQYVCLFTEPVGAQLAEQLEKDQLVTVEGHITAVKRVLGYSYVYVNVISLN